MTLGIDSDDPVRIFRMVQVGFPYSRLVRLQKATGLPMEKIASFVAISPRTLTRRQHENRLQPEESDRLLRASRIFEMVVDLFEGDVDGAMQWLQKPHHALGDVSLLEFASTDVGAREVEGLIGQLEHGIFP